MDLVSTRLGGENDWYVEELPFPRMLSVKVGGELMQGIGLFWKTLRWLPWFWNFGTDFKKWVLFYENLV